MLRRTKHIVRTIRIQDANQTQVTITTPSMIDGPTLLACLWETTSACGLLLLSSSSPLRSSSSSSSSPLSSSSSSSSPPLLLLSLLLLTYVSNILMCVISHVRLNCLSFNAGHYLQTFRLSFFISAILITSLTSTILYHFQ